MARIASYAQPVTENELNLASTQDVSVKCRGWFRVASGIAPMVLITPSGPDDSSALIITKLVYPMEVKNYWNQLLQEHHTSSLAEKLMEIRKRIVTSKIPLLTWEEIELEREKRRGEH